MEVLKKYLCEKLSLTKRGGLLLLPLLFFGIFAPSHFAHAGILDTLTQISSFVFLLPFLPFMVIIKLSASMAIMLFGFIPVALSALILNFIIGDHLIMLPYTHGGFVDIGWTITRDLANLMFIVIIVIMAIATILGQQNRGIGLLPKLIGVALIVNFTKVIAGIIVDIANIVTNYFLDPVKNIGNLFINLFGKETPVWQFINKIIELFNNFNIENIWDLADEFTFSAMLGDIIGAVMIIIVGLMMAFTLLVFAAIFFMRYIAIWMLVILSPLAFAAMILPDTQKFFKQWWDAFIKWSFIGVGPAFILFLTAKIIEAKNEILGPGGWQGEILGEGDFFQQLFRPFYAVINEILFWIIIIAFMWIGLTMTLKMNSGVSNIIVKWSRKGMGAAAGVAKRKVSERVAPAVGERGRKLAAGEGRIGGMLAKTPLRGAARGAGVAAMKYEAKVRAQTADDRKEYDKLDDPKQKYARWINDNSHAGMVSGAQSMIEDEDDFDEAKKWAISQGEGARFDAHFKKSLQVAKFRGQHKKLLVARPDMAGDVGMDTEEFVSRMDADKIKRISKEGYNAEVGRGLLKNRKFTPQALSAMEQDPDTRDRAHALINGMKETTSEDIARTRGISLGAARISPEEEHLKMMEDEYGRDEISKQISSGLARSLGYDMSLVRGSKAPAAKILEADMRQVERDIRDLRIKLRAERLAGSDDATVLRPLRDEISDKVSERTDLRNQWAGG